MIYGLDDYIDKTLSLTTTLTRIIDHYSECDNPEGGMWDVESTDDRNLGHWVWVDCHVFKCDLVSDTQKVLPYVLREDLLSKNLELVYS